MPNAFIDYYRQNVDDPRDDYTITREVLGPLAQQNPEIFEAYPDFAQEYRAIREANAPSLGGEVTRGLKRGGLGLLSTGAGGLSLFTGDGWLRRKAKELDERAGAPDLAPTVPTLEDIAPGEEETWRKVLSRDALRYGASKFGEAAPSIAEAVGTTIAGAAIGTASAPGPGTVAGAGAGLVGRGLVRTAIRELVRKGAAEEAIIAGLRAATPEVVNAVATTARGIAAVRGGTAAAALNSYLLNAGDVLNEVPDEPGLAAALGVVSAIPDTILPAVILRKLFPGVGLRVAQQEAKELVANRALDLTKKLGLGAGSVAGEGATEYFQEAVNVVARNIRDGRDPLAFDDADMRRFREAGITGMAGGLLAAPAVAMQRRKTDVSTDAQPAVAATATPAPTNSTPVSSKLAVPAARTNAQIVAAVEAMDDATAVARRDELRAKPSLAPEEETELELLLAKVPVNVSAPPQSARPTTLPLPGSLPNGQLLQSPGERETPAGTPSGDGAPAGSPAAALGNSAPQERERLGQPTGELGTGQQPIGSPQTPSPAAGPVVNPSAAVLGVQSEGQPARVSGSLQEVLQPTEPAAPARRVESTYLYTIQRPQGEVPGYMQIDEIVNGESVGSHTIEDLARAGKTIPTPPAWLPTGQYTLEQVTEAIANGSPSPAPEVSPLEEPPAPPKVAAPAVAAQPDLPKPADVAPVVASTTPAPEERAAVKAVEAKPQPLTYGPIMEGDPTMDFRDFEPIKPTDWERAIRANLKHPLAARGDKSGARSTTRVGLAMVEPDGKGVVLAGVVVPQRLLKVGGGTEIDGVALQRFGSGMKKRMIDLGGDQPVLLREAIAAGFRPLAVMHFTGEPTKIFQRFNTLADFDQAYAATEKATGRAGAARVETPNAVAEVRQAIRGEREIQAEIDRLGAEYQKADKATQEQLSLEIVRLFDELNDVLRKGQNQTGDIALRTSVALAPVLADRTQQFIAVMDRLRRAGANVQLLTQEMFAAATGRTNAAGAAFSPWHVALVLDDVQNARMDNLVTLLHEASEALAMGLNPAVKGRIARAIQNSLTDIRAKTAASSAQTGAPAATETGLFDALAESLAQRLAAEGVADAPNLAQAIWRWVKDLYFRAAMAVQRAFGAEPSDELALDWFENQLRRVVGGDYDYRIARLLDRYLPEPMAERVRRFAGRGQTPGGVVDYWNPYTRAMQQPTVLGNIGEGVAWNMEFRTVGDQNEDGLSIPGPEARARIEAAALNKFAEQMEAVRVASGTDKGWAEWWASVGTGDDPKVLLAALAERAPGAETATIGGDRMTRVMNDLAALEARRMLEHAQASAVKRAADAQEQIDVESDRVIEAAKEVNRIEGDRRNAQLQEATLQEKLKRLVRRFVQDNSAGYKLAEQQGELAEAVRQAEGLIESDPIPEQYQQVFKAILDGKVSVFDYVRAIAELDLPLSDMTQREVVKAISDNAEANATLKSLANNRPLLVALSVLAKKNAGQVDEIHLGWLRDAEKYRAIHEQLQQIRQATDEQLRQMLSTVNEQVKAGGLSERLKGEYLKRRRALRTARDRVAAAQQRVDLVTTALPALNNAVEQAQQTGSEAPSEWAPTDGARFTEMKLGEDGTWTRSERVLRFRGDGSAVDGDAVRRAVWQNNLWLKANEAKRGSALYERVLRQTTQLAMLDLTAQYPAAQGFRVDKLLAPLVAEARQLGAAGARVAQMLQQFQFIRFSHGQEVQTNAQAWSHAWGQVQKATGITDNGLLREQVYDPVSYFLNTEPGLDEEAALREAIKMARARLTKPPAEGFSAAMENLLRASKTGFEFLLQQANQYGAFVRDPRLKSELRRAVAQGWLTSMRSVDGGLVMRITRDMERAGWRLARRTVEDWRGRKRPEIVRGVTFEDVDAEGAANTAGLDEVLRRLFTPGIVRDWLVPFINKGGVEVFKGPDGEAIPQIVLQNAWARAGGNVLTWIDLVGADVGLPTPEATETGQTDPVADFRVSMLRQLDALFGMEAKLAYEASQTRDMFDPMGPKPHVMMDARLNDTVPPEHLDFALLDPHTSQMLLGEIAFHAAFGRNGERMVQTLFELRQLADAQRQQYESLTGTTRNARVAEAAARGWNYDELERAAVRARDVQEFQRKLEGLLGADNPAGPFGDQRVWASLVNFMSGQIVDNPKTAFYNLLTLAQTPFAMRSLGPKSIRAVSDAFMATMKTGLGSILEAMNLHLLHASAYEKEVAQALGASRNAPWSQAVSDIGPGGRQSLGEQAVIRPLRFLRYVQNKGVGGFGTAQDFPRLAVVPGLGVSTAISQIAAVGGVSAQLQMLERIIRSGLSYFASHRDAADNPSFRFKAADLGLGRADTGVFDWWRTKSVEYGLGTLEDLVRASVPLAAKGERLLSRDQVLRVAQAFGQELAGDSSINTTPSFIAANPWLRTFFPLLRWPLWAMHKTHEGFRTSEGRMTYASVARGLAILAMWNLPIGLAFTFLLDRYDDEVLGKKSNLPPLNPTAALPFVGPAAELIMADRSIPDTLKSFFVRSARAGNIYGLASDYAAQLASPTDAASGRRTFSLDQRVLVMSQLHNIQQAISNLIHQENATWASVWAPLFRSVGGNAAIHTLDVANNLLGLDNAERRNVMRINAQNWLRAAAGELEIELKSGGGGTPTPLSAWSREMQHAAMANDRIGFLEAYNKALEAARKVVSGDPSVPVQEREREAERRVLASWRSRNPLYVFQRMPTEIEVRRMLSIMDDEGAQSVRDAINRFNQFSKLIAVSPMEQQQRALERRLVRPPALTNPFRRQLTTTPTY